jgi:hypothetical protein
MKGRRRFGQLKRISSCLITLAPKISLGNKFNSICLEEPRRCAIAAIEGFLLRLDSVGHLKMSEN